MRGEEKQRQHLVKKNTSVRGEWESYYDDKKDFTKERRIWEIVRRDFDVFTGDDSCAECGKLLSSGDKYRKAGGPGRIFLVRKTLRKYENHTRVTTEKDEQDWLACGIDCAFLFRNKSRENNIRWKHYLRGGPVMPCHNKRGSDEIQREPFYYGGAPGLGKRR